MPGDACIVCGNSRKKQPELKYHRIPSDPEKRALWLQVFNISAGSIKPHHRICSWHFKDGNPNNKPEVNIGKKFASPIKKGTLRAQRAELREKARENQQNLCSVPDRPAAALPGPSSVLSGTSAALPGPSSALPGPSAALPGPSSASSGIPSVLPLQVFTIEEIQHDDKLVCFYTGFVSYKIYLAFFNFLGPAVDKLNYWGCKYPGPKKRQRVMKLSPMNQLFMTLVKLRLNLKVLDLAFRFGISPASVSRYFTTWICFLYHHLKEIDWMPSVEQVLGTLPPSFRERCPSTFAIIDASEIFIETPSDLHMQSSTWSSYKHHNTAKFLIACTPNGCISWFY